MKISIHALLAESDGGFGAGSWRLVIFLSTLSLRRATLPAPLTLPPSANFYPRSPCGERPSNAATTANEALFLSTLSLRRATLFLRCGPMMRRYFYPRSPCGERLPGPRLCPSRGQFLSTLSLRRATGRGLLPKRGHWNFYPRSPCGERHSECPHTRQRDVISIHALLAESDSPTYRWQRSGIVFLSTLSLRRATDKSQMVLQYSRFLSTLSLRRATPFMVFCPYLLL